MMRWRLATRVLSCILALLLTPLCAFAESATQYAPWRDYVLIVESASDDPEVVNYSDEEKPNARFVKVWFTEMSLPIKTDDILQWYTDFSLRDTDGNNYPAEAFWISSLQIVGGQLSMDSDQDIFAVYFDIPEGITLDALKLYVKTALETEFVTVSLAKVPHESAQGADTDESADGVAASGGASADEPADPPTSSAEKSTPFGPRLADALGVDAYQTTYAYLAEGNLLKNGSNNSAAKGLQMLLRELGAKITADGKIGPKSITSLGEIGAWFAPLDDAGKVTTVDAQIFEDLMLLLLLTKDYEAAVTLLEGDAEADQLLDLFDAANQALLGNFYSAQQGYLSLSGFRQSDLRAKNCQQAFPRTGLLYRNEAYPSKRCELTIKVGGYDGEATYVKIYTLSDDLVLTAFIPSGQKTRVDLPAGTFVIKTGTGTQWFGQAEAFGEEEGARYRRLYLDSGEDTITLESGYSYTLSLSIDESTGGDDVSSWPESWADF